MQSLAPASPIYCQLVKAYTKHYDPRLLSKLAVQVHQVKPDQAMTIFFSKIKIIDQQQFQKENQLIQPILQLSKALSDSSPENEQFGFSQVFRKDSKNAANFQQNGHQILTIIRGRLKDLEEYIEHLQRLGKNSCLEKECLRKLHRLIQFLSSYQSASLHSARASPSLTSSPSNQLFSLSKWKAIQSQKKRSLINALSPSSTGGATFRQATTSKDSPLEEIESGRNMKGRRKKHQTHRSIANDRQAQLDEKEIKKSKFKLRREGGWIAENKRRGGNIQRRPRAAKMGSQRGREKLSQKGREPKNTSLPVDGIRTDRIVRIRFENRFKNNRGASSLPSQNKVKSRNPSQQSNQAPAKTASFSSSSGQNGEGDQIVEKSQVSVKTMKSVRFLEEEGSQEQLQTERSIHKNERTWVRDKRRYNRRCKVKAKTANNHQQKGLSQRSLPYSQKHISMESSRLTPKKKKKKGQQDSRKSTQPTINTVTPPHTPSRPIPQRHCYLTDQQITQLLQSSQFHQFATMQSTLKKRHHCRESHMLHSDTLPITRLPSSKVIAIDAEERAGNKERYRSRVVDGSGFRVSYQDVWRLKKQCRQASRYTLQDMGRVYGGKGFRDNQRQILIDDNGLYIFNRQFICRTARTPILPPSHHQITKICPDMTLVSNSRGTKVEEEGLLQLGFGSLHDPTPY